MTAEALHTFNPKIAAAVSWVLEHNPERPVIPKLRDRFGLTAAEAITVLRLVRDIRDGRGGDAR